MVNVSSDAHVTGGEAKIVSNSARPLESTDSNTSGETSCGGVKKAVEVGGSSVGGYLTVDIGAKHGSLAIGSADLKKTHMNDLGRFGDKSTPIKVSGAGSTRMVNCAGEVVLEDTVGVTVLTIMSNKNVVETS